MVRDRMLRSIKWGKLADEMSAEVLTQLKENVRDEENIEEILSTSMHRKQKSLPNEVL